jgi:hypothetical protein
MVGPDGLEPSTPRLSSACSNQLSYEPRVNWQSTCPVYLSLGGADRVRTGDPLLAKQMLYQLSYDPRQGLYSAVLKNISQNLLCAINQDPDYLPGPCGSSPSSFDHRRDHLRDVAVSLERR